MDRNSRDDMQDSPIVYVLEAVAVGDIIHQGDPVRASVVRAGDHVKLFLPSRIPDLALDTLAVDLQGLDLTTTGGVLLSLRAWCLVGGN